MKHISMNKARAKKIGAVYYKDAKSKLFPGDVTINPVNGKVIKFPKDLKKFNDFCDKLFDGYFLKVKPNDAINKALSIETRLEQLEIETKKLEQLQCKYREQMMALLTKNQNDVICLLIHRNHKEMLSVNEITKNLEGDKLISLGRRYDNKSHGSLWVALIQTNGFVDYKSYYISKSQFKKLNDVGYRPGKKFEEGMDLILFNDGKKLTTPLDMGSIRKKLIKKEIAARKRKETKKWKSIKTYDDKKEHPQKTKIFVYKGFLGMITHPRATGLVAVPEKGNLGVVIEAKHCEITPEAKQVINNAWRELGSFASIQLINGNKPCIGWLGGYKMVCRSHEVVIGRDCDKSTLDKMDLVDVTSMELPRSFVEYVDKQNEKLRLK